jgi:hypothetical protein
MTLVKSLHSGDPNMIHTPGHASALYSGLVTGKCYSEKKQLHAYPGDPTFELHLFAKCMSAIHWGSHEEDLNNNSISCSNGSFLEYSPPTTEARVRFLAGTCQSQDL